MKGFLAILGLAVAGFAGYKAEPSMRYQLTGHAPKEAESTPAEAAPPATPAPAANAVAVNPPPVVPTQPPAVAATDPTPAPVPEPVPAPEPMPVPEPAPAVVPVVPPADGDFVVPPENPPEPAPIPATAVDVVAVMKKHISEGNIKEFTFNQVQGWKAEPNEVIDGETYQIGLIRYNAETIFGNKSIEAKALIKNGQVVRWIWPKSNMEIK
jgi:hypothetical protein